MHGWEPEEGFLTPPGSAGKGTAEQVTCELACEGWWELPRDEEGLVRGGRAGVCRHQGEQPQRLGKSSDARQVEGFLRQAVIV